MSQCPLSSSYPVPDIPESPSNKAVLMLEEGRGFLEREAASSSHLYRHDYHHDYYHNNHDYHHDYYYYS